jgi:hypothetical protein
MCSRSSKFGTNIYQLSSDRSLMFWGGEMTREITMLNEKALPRLTQHKSKGDSNQLFNAKNKTANEKTKPPVDFNSVPSFELKIAAGAPSRSRSPFLCTSCASPLAL